MAKVSRPRKLHQEEYRSFRLSRPIKNHMPELDSSRSIFWTSIKFLIANKGIFISFSLAYGLFVLFLIRGFSGGFDVSGAKENISQITNGNFNNFNSSFMLLGLMLGGAFGTTNEMASIYQIIAVVLFSLAIIYTIRKIYYNQQVSFKSAFYKGVYPLVPFSICLITIALTIIPFRFGQFIYDIVRFQYLAVTSLGRAFWVAFYVGFLILSLRLFVEYFFSIYIACLPDMEPSKALKSSRKLAKNRLVAVGFRLFAVLFWIIVLSIFTLLPAIYYAPAFAEVLFYFAVLFLLPIVHTYCYFLYQNLIKTATIIKAKEPDMN